MGNAISSLGEQATRSPFSQFFLTSSDYPATRIACDPPTSILEDSTVTPMDPPPSSPGDNDVVAMTRCQECGHMVPEGNLAIHQAHACGGRARRPIRNEEEQPPAAVETTGIRQRRTTDTSSLNENSSNGGNLKQQDVIDLDSDEEEEEIQVVEHPSNQWACPRCTLLNDNTETSCGACHFTKNLQTRTADPTRRERLVHNEQHYRNHPQNQPPPPGAFVGGGALLGGVLGAAGAAMRGHSWVGGAMEGAVSGAMGGAVLGSTTNQMAQQQQQQRYRQQPRSSIRVNRSDSGMHITTTVFSPDGRVQRRVVQGGPGGVDPLLGFLMANAMHRSPQQYRGMNVDNMSYEQLLETFGDGSENRGADASVISSLPVSRVTQDTPPEKADCDHAKCSICLELFQKGDLRKTLPCLHAYHEECIDSWLRGNGTCPICKHTVSS